MTKLWEKVERCAVPDLRIADFGTRRRHSFLWQDWCVQAMREGLGDSFVGTSNCLIAMNRELRRSAPTPMNCPWSMPPGRQDDAPGQAPYDVLADWHEEHDGNLRIILPDTYGTKGSLTTRPTGWPAGPASASISGDPRPAPKSPSTGGNRAARTRRKAGHLLGRAGRRQDHRPASPIRRPRAACPSAGAPC